jgi:GntR family transcriptional regulator / MocR family aminotransferase
VYVMTPSPLAQSVANAGITWPLWQYQAAREAEGYQKQVPAAVRPGSSHPAPITFTGVGDPSHFPVRELYQAMRTVIGRDGTAALEYGDFSGGYPPLRRTISHVLASQGIQCQPENILITSGSQQALALVCHCLLKPGDTILVENPTYNLALELFHALKLKLVTIPVTEHGMQVELLEPLLQQHHPKLIYTIPNFQNPTGTCLGGGQRRRLVALAERYNVPILEDDFAGDLRYDGRAQPAIKALDPGGRVIYTATFSKMLMPGLRVGFLAAEGPIFDVLVDFKRVHDLTTSTLMQRVLDEYVTVGRYQAHLRRSCRVYRKRRDAMFAAVQRYLPAEVQFHPPPGGLFAWLRLPPAISALKLLPVAHEEGVTFAPGSWFFAVPDEGNRYLRLNFARQPPREIDRGIQRLAAAVRRLG